MGATATLALSVRGRLCLPKALPAAPVRCGLFARARLTIPRRLGPVHARLGLTAHALAPRGLGAQLRLVTAKYSRAVLSQSLRVWVNTTPPGLMLALRVDDGPERVMAWHWDNPTGGLPAIYTLADPHLPADGFSHDLTLSAWRETKGIRSAAAYYRLTAKVAAAPVPQPQWISARLVRQTTDLRPDLIEIRWRAATAVTLLANLRTRYWGTGNPGPALTLRLGTAGADEERLLYEGIGPQLVAPGSITSGLPCDVYLGVVGIANGQESPVLWATQPLSILSLEGEPSAAPATPDTLAGTAQSWPAETLTGVLEYYPLTLDIRAAVATTLALPPQDISPIVDQAFCGLWRRLKLHVKAEDRVTLDDFGTFGAKWTQAGSQRDPQTGAITPIPSYRQPTFTPSPGYKLGTKRGQRLTDAQAKELP